MDAYFLCEPATQQHIAVSAITGGDVIELADGRAAIACEDIAASGTGTVATEGLVRFTAGSATTFAVGDAVYWDDSADTAITTPGEAADIYLGVCAVAKTNGQTSVDVVLNVSGPSAVNAIRQSRILEVDCQVDTAAVTLIPAAWNQMGLIFICAYGIVTEQFAGSSQDQGIVTIKDSATSPNTMATLTPTDGGADSVGDVIVGTNPLIGVATGTAVITVAAGLAVTATCTQNTAGTSAAGKMKVRVLYAPLAG